MKQRRRSFWVLLLANYVIIATDRIIFITSCSTQTAYLIKQVHKRNAS